MFQGIGLFKPFKKQEPRKFNYKARYYDRESAEIRKQKILEGEENTTVNFSDRLHQKISESRKIKQNSIRKLAIMAGLLALLFYILLK
jgi:hypothetical protein